MITFTLLLVYQAFLLVNCKKEGTVSPPITTITQPSPRYSFALAYDDARSKLVLFGGFNQGKFMNDTWEWDGIKWEQKIQDSPSPRNGSVMTYNSSRKTIILFGGDNGSKFFNDTWEWNGSIWKQLSAEGPFGRSNHTLDFDKQRNKVVLFGGRDAQKTMNDLWEWDGAKWVQSNTTSTPDARFLHASSYDEKINKVLIFGGNTIVGPPTQASIKGDLWSWDGNKWEQIKSNGQTPSPRDHVNMVYDPLSKKSIVHGGGKFDGSSASDTWDWDGNLWTIRVPTSTAPLEGYKLVYDSKNETVLLFGGFVGGAASSSIWKLSGGEWSLVK